MESQVYRNTRFWLISRTESVVLFIPHYCTGNAPERHVYRCTPEQWDNGNLFGH